MKRWQGFERGINLGGWFSQCKYTEEHFDTFIKEQDFERIAGWGLDHVRLPFDYNFLETEDGEYIDKGFERLTVAIGWARKNGLNLILDLHKTFGYSFDAGEKQEGFFENEEYQERFYRLWERMAAYYGNMHENVAFELLNEVTDPQVSDVWNKIAAKCIKRIRVYAPDTYILIGSYWNNSVSSVKALEAPYDDKIVYNFHCYEPMIFTHQGAGWIDCMPGDFRISYDSTYSEFSEALKTKIPGGEFLLPDMGEPNQKADAEFFIRYFKEAVEHAEKYDVPLYCGEYGVIDLAEPKDALNWYRAIHEAFVHYGINRAAWSYRNMNFGFVDEHFAPVLDEVVKVL